MKPDTVIKIAALLALAAKLYCAATTVGTNDADTFYNFGRFIWERGLLAQYRATPEFNHTPLTGWFCAAAYGLGSGWGFTWLLRLPGILADFFSVRLLVRWPAEGNRPPYWATALFALSPVNFMISGFHGNVDSVLAWLLLVATRECLRDRAIFCGLAFGLACQIKVIPLLLAPVFFFFWFHRNRWQGFLCAATVIILVGWAFPLVTMPETFLRNVLGYNSNWGSWGVTYWLAQTGWPPFVPIGFQGLTQWQLAIMMTLKIGIVSAALGLGWLRRAEAPAGVPASLALVGAVFFIFAPGVGAQYLVWFAPFFLLRSPRWYAALTAASAAFLFVFYNTISHGFPWDHGVSTADLVPQWAGWSNLPWLTLAAFLGWNLRRRPRPA
jgi:hypothetical protein